MRYMVAGAAPHTAPVMEKGFRGRTRMRLQRFTLALGGGGAVLILEYAANIHPQLSVRRVWKHR